MAVPVQVGRPDNEPYTTSGAYAYCGNASVALTGQADMSRWRWCTNGEQESAYCFPIRYKGSYSNIMNFSDGYRISLKYILQANTP